MNPLRQWLNRKSSKAPRQSPITPAPTPALDLQNWPSVPGESKQVATLDTLIQANDDAAKHAHKLKHEPTLDNYTAVDFQVVVEGRFGVFCLPALAQNKDGQFEVLLSHAGEWVKDDVNRLLNWVLKLRSAETTARLPIRLFFDGDSYPVWIAEVLSDQPRHLMMLSIMPYLEERHFVNAGLFAQSFQFTFNQTLPKDLSALKILDQAVRERIAPIADESFYKQYLVQTMGAFFGEMINRELNTQWAPSPNPDIPWDVIPFGEMLLNPFGKVSKQLEDETERAGMASYMDFLKTHYKDRR